MSKSAIPYASATNGAAAREEITKIPRHFGCESVGFMDDFAQQTVLLAFTHRGRQVQPRASAKGCMQMYLKETPSGPRRRGPRQDYEAAVLQRGLIAGSSILCDWMKGQMTAIECGLLSSDSVFLPYMLVEDGRLSLERLRKERLLPASQATE